MVENHSNGETTIYARALAKRFRTRRGAVDAVDGVDLEVRQGEIFGLIGPDGAGKTTTIRVILGLLKRSGGESHVLGYDSMRNPYQIRERVGYIAQQFALPGDMTVQENMRFFAEIHGVPRREQRQRIASLLEFAGLVEFKSRAAEQLSGGMKKKLALACSLVHEPQVLMLDEPTLGVDPISRRQFWDLLSDLRAEKALTIFVCTPYMDEAERCHRVALMYRGRLIACDAPKAIKQDVPGRLLAIAPSGANGALTHAREKLAGLEGVLEVQTYGRMLHAFVDDVAVRKPQIRSALAAEGIECESMREIEPRMEEAFISLILRRQRQEAA